MKRLIALFLALLLLTGCASGGSTNLMETITPNTVTLTQDPTVGTRAVADFGIRLLRQSGSARGNTLVSPLSVLSALAMTLNGASRETRSQMEAVLGADRETLNLYFHHCLKNLPRADGCALRLANSLWLKDSPDFYPEEIFLQTNADYYDADVFASAFDDAARDAINEWVKKNTGGMIPEIIDEIPADAVMYLVNALAFEGEWEESYSRNRVISREFTRADGSKCRVEMMHSEEGLYLEDDLATGLVKYYAGRRCAFVALLPNEGVSLEEYVANLTGDHLLNLVKNPTEIPVEAGIPKFSLEYRLELSRVLASMGMHDAFDPVEADFSLLGKSDRGNLFLDRVMHKTFIELDEKGTKAAAATSVEVTNECAVDPDSYRTVVLNRPFVYALVDMETGMPFFLGTMLDPEQKQNEGNPADDILKQLKQEPTEPEDLYAAEPPILHALLLALDEKMERPATRFTITWDHLADNGERVAICADCPHPLQARNLIQPIHVFESAVELSFSRKPDSVTIGAWRDSEWDNPDAPQVPVEFDGTWMTLLEGGWIYEITATWEPNGDQSHGTVQYAMYVVKEEWDDAAFTGYNRAVVTDRYGKTIAVEGEDALWLTGLLGSLSYDPQRMCKCLPEYDVVVSEDLSWGLNLSEGYARNGVGQARLTREQVDRIRDILGLE